MKIYGIVIFWMIISVTFGDEVCPQKFVNLLNGCYFFPNMMTTWYKAWQYCTLLNSHLVSIESYEENNAIYSYINATIPTLGRTLWTSGNDLVGPHHWIWMNTGLPINPYDWCDGHPVPGNSAGHNCMAMFSRPLSGHSDCWVQLPCNDILYSICERNVY